MAITEEMRHQIYEAFRASLGDEVANSLMEMLPPVGWADVATRQDLAAIEERMDLRFGVFESRLGEQIQCLRVEMHRELREQASRFIGWMFAAVGISSTIAGGIAALS
ncbi:MAG TPA: hypothetical protein VI916_01140 [Acidimicrobiia bacterium]|nr:hypothetical protein [Acidimicrobiia bacterium]